MKTTYAKEQLVKVGGTYPARRTNTLSATSSYHSVLVRLLQCDLDGNEHKAAWPGGGGVKVAGWGASARCWLLAAGQAT